MAKKSKKTSKSQDIKKGIKYEKDIARKRKAKHKGGPGNPDYIKGKNTQGEVKKTKAKVTRPQLQKIAKKGITEVESHSGFTGPAKEYRDIYRPKLKLTQQEKTIRKKKKKK